MGLPVTLVNADDQDMGAKTASVSIMRTNDTNAYGAVDCIGAAVGSTSAIEFANIGTNKGAIDIVSTSLRIDATALIASEAGYTLHLYSATPPSALGDNVAWDLPSGDRSVYLGKLALGTPVDLGSTLWVEVNNIWKQVRLTTSSLFGYLTTDAAHTPVASRVYTVTLNTKPA
jgi:hypothetical protein